MSEYRDLKRTLDRLTGKINGKYAEFDWVPLRYMTHGLSRKMLAGFFRKNRCPISAFGKKDTASKSRDAGTHDCYLPLHQNDLRAMSHGVI